MDRRLRDLNRELAKIPQQAHSFFRKTTPIKTGNARNKTSFDAPNTINADYPYANRLNEGYSRQAKDGMTRPTIQYIRSLIKKI
jgi:hypothetical protein